MEIVHLATGYVGQTVGLIALIATVLFAAIEVRHLVKSQRVANIHAIKSEHREIWSVYLQHPSLARVLNPKADLAKNPVTTEESIFVKFLILHTYASFKAEAEGMFVPPEQLAKDIRSFFPLPIPKAVWNELRQFQDADFLRFMEESLQ